MTQSTINIDTRFTFFINVRVVRKLLPVKLSRYHDEKGYM